MPREFENEWRYKGSFTWPGQDEEKNACTAAYTGVNVSPTAEIPMKTHKRPRKQAGTTALERNITDNVTPQGVTWQNLEQLDWFQVLATPMKKKCESLAKLAEETQIALNQAASVYVGLVRYVKTSQLEPEIVRNTLAARGYNPSRISEILKVATGPEDVIEAFEARTIGFKRAVERARLAENQTPASRLSKKLNKAVAGLVRVAVKSDWTFPHIEEEGNFRIEIHKIANA